MAREIVEVKLRWAISGDRKIQRCFEVKDRLFLFEVRRMSSSSASLPPKQATQPSPLASSPLFLLSRHPLTG